uniref:(California timema) hypothetical protein n=1 Tax=Timema californicum TaxID=61474 RepID=A0A7R9P540_TIMCA|nr:unnamed protein product [Timema californicum]
MQNAFCCDKCKNVDENGNAVNQSYRTEAVPNNERKEKKRRTKTNTDRNVIMSQNIEGHRGDKDIDSLIKFIESDGEGKSKQKTNYHTNGSINFSSRHRNNVKKEDSNTVPKAKREEEEKVTRSRIQSGKKERCTDKGSQLKKSNSLEEISKSKLEDLMVNDDTVKKPLGTVSVSLEFEQNKNHALPSEDEENENVKLFVNENEDNNLWWSKQENNSGKEFVDQNPNLALVGKKRREEKKKRENLPPRNEEILSTASIPLEEPDFYVVKKKQRKKKRRSSTGGQGRDSLFDEDTNMGRFTSTTNQYGTKDYQTRRGLVSNSSVFPPHDHTLNRNEGSMILYQYRHLRQRSPDHRRKSTSSMPPSDKSESSDLDSVHSLPVSSTTPKPALDQTSTSSGSTPQASYADIARMASVNIVPMNCSGKAMTNDQLEKLLNNKKSTIKKKIDLSATGNKPIKLLDSLELLNTEENPVFTKISAATSIGMGNDKSGSPSVQIIGKLPISGSNLIRIDSEKHNEIDSQKPLHERPKHTAGSSGKKKKCLQLKAMKWLIQQLPSFSG